MKTTSRLALAALMALLARPAMGQASVAGTWIAEFEHRIRDENGEVSADKGKARIVFEVKGDSVFGTWAVLTPPPEPGMKPRHLRGTIANGRVRVAGEPVDAVLNVNGSESHVSMVTTYDFAVNGDALTGTAEIKSGDGSMPPMSRPFSASRVKS
jgi:hypothetical protein